MNRMFFVQDTNVCFANQSSAAMFLLERRGFLLQPFQAFHMLVEAS